MAFDGDNPQKFYRPLAIVGSVNATETLTGARTLTLKDGQFLKLDPGGANRDVTLPAIEKSDGVFIRICNAADAAENLVVKNAAAATIATLNQNEAAWFGCSGAAWIHYGIETIALS